MSLLLFSVHVEIAQLCILVFIAMRDVMLQGLHADGWRESTTTAGPGWPTGPCHGSSLRPRCPRFVGTGSYDGARARSTTAHGLVLQPCPALPRARFTHRDGYVLLAAVLGVGVCVCRLTLSACGTSAGTSLSSSFHQKNGVFIPLNGYRWL